MLEVDDELMRDIEELTRSRSDYLLLNIIQDLYPADVAHLMDRMDHEESQYLFSLLANDIAREALLELDETHREYLLRTLPPDHINELVEGMESDDAADIVGSLPGDRAEAILKTLGVEKSSRVEELLRYGASTAGGLMAKEMAVVHGKDTVKRAIQVVRRLARKQKNVYTVYVTDDHDLLVGSVALQDLLLYAPNKRVHTLMTHDVLSVTTDVDQEEVAGIFRKYDIVSLPVTDAAGRLLGRITVDDIVDVLEEEHQEDVAKMVGSDAEELERRSPARIALMRLPWVLITLLIELGAGIVIHQFDATLAKVILLASFMPIISAISGNTGLQSAAIVVRGIATGHIDLNRWWIPVTRQLQTSVIIGGVCGSFIAVVGAVWHGHVTFGLVVGISMFISVNISGFVGTVTPMLSKRLGFDPAITAGPFETAFQDVVGISIFLSLATLLLHWL